MTEPAGENRNANCHPSRPFEFQGQGPVRPGAEGGTNDGPASFTGLRAFPTNPYRLSELPPRKTAVTEATAGALLGGLVGLWVGGAEPSLSAALALLFGTAAGAANGLLAGAVTFRSGSLTPQALSGAALRVLFVDLVLVAAPWLAVRWAMAQDAADS